MFKRKYKDHMNSQSPSAQAVDGVKEKMSGSEPVAYKPRTSRFQRSIALATCLTMLITTVTLATFLGRTPGYEPFITQSHGELINLSTASSYEEIFELIAGFSRDSNGYLGSQNINRPGLGEESNDAGMSDQDSGMNAPQTGGNYAPDFSDTNLQVLGVQEGDIVKTDGFHIFTVSDTFINVISASNGQLELLWQIPRASAADNRQRTTFEMYITPGRLILMSNVWDTPDWQYWGNDVEWDMPIGGGWGWWGAQNQGVVAEIYDVSDMNRAPIRLGEVGQSGSYVSSRMIGTTMYLVTNHGNWFGRFYLERPETFLPQVFENGTSRTISPQNVILGDGDLSRVQYTVISGIDTTGSGSVIGTQALMDMGWQVYSSHNNMYVTATQWRWAGDGEHRWDGSTNNGVSYQITQVTRIALNNGNVRAEASVLVDGWVLNQFAMDEFDNTFRIITSQRRDYWERVQYFGPTDHLNGWYSGYWDDNNVWQGDIWHISHWEFEVEVSPGIFQWVRYQSCWENPGNVYRETNTEVSTNNVFVMDMNMNVIGDIRGLAPGERVFSVRFMQEIAFFVTFRDTDPLFSVDFSDPRNPVILGELKIPGFSDYLQPFGAGRLFGFGRYVCEDTGWWGYLRISMFNTEDLTNVYKRHYLDLTGFWWSESNWNHRAILVCERRNIIGFQSDNAYLIYGYCDETGFFRRGIIEFENKWCEWWGWWRSWWGQMRGLYIGNYFYVITGSHIASFCLETFERVDFVRLEEERDWGQPWQPEPPMNDWPEEPTIDYEWEAMTLEERALWFIRNQRAHSVEINDSIAVFTFNGYVLMLYTTECGLYGHFIVDFSDNLPWHGIIRIGFGGYISYLISYDAAYLWGGFWSVDREKGLRYNFFPNLTEREYFIINGERIELQHFTWEINGIEYDFAFWYIFVDCFDDSPVFG